MKKAIACLLLIIAVSPLAKAQDQAATGIQDYQTVEFCNLVRHPDQYDGKRVKVTATYVGHFHGASFYDDACKKSQSDPEVMANAKFKGDDVESMQAFNKLSKFLDKYRIDTARITMIAVFTDIKSTNMIIVCVGCYRFTLQVKQILAMERIKPPATSR
jgi:hypothetical protein